jgi:hypothetical protein
MQSFEDILKVSKHVYLPFIKTEKFSLMFVVEIRKYLSIPKIILSTKSLRNAYHDQGGQGRL